MQLHDSPVPLSESIPVSGRLCQTGVSLPEDGATLPLCLH